MRVFHNTLSNNFIEAAQIKITLSRTDMEKTKIAKWRERLKDVLKDVSVKDS